MQPAQPSCVFFRQGDRLAGAVGHGQRHCGRAHGVEVQVRDPADGLLGVVVLLALSLEGVSQMVYILPERLPALVRPAFDLVLRRIRSLKRCVQA